MKWTGNDAECIPFGKLEQATLIFNGNDVVKIEPKGINYPFYQRDHYRASNTLWKKVSRFEPDESFPDL